MDKFFCLSLIFIPKEIHSAERYSIFVATEIVDMKTIYINLLFFFFPGRMLQSVALWQNHTRWCCYNDSHHGLGSVHYVKRILLAIDRLVTKMSLGPKNMHIFWFTVNQWRWMTSIEMLSCIMGYTLTLIKAVQNELCYHCVILLTLVPYITLILSYILYRYHNSILVI